MWVDTALEAIKLQCVNTIEVKNDFRQNEGRELEQEIRDQLCPQDCNSHGRCQNGKRTLAQCYDSDWISLLTSQVAQPVKLGVGR